MITAMNSIHVTGNKALRNGQGHHTFLSYRIRFLLT